MPIPPLNSYPRSRIIFNKKMSYFATNKIFDFITRFDSLKQNLWRNKTFFCRISTPVSDVIFVTTLYCSACFPFMNTKNLIQLQTKKLWNPQNKSKTHTITLFEPVKYSRWHINKTAQNVMKYRGIRSM